MAVLRKNKKTDFTVIDNNIFKNKQLSLKAKGMICTMLSLPDDWNFSEMGLVELSNDSRSGIRNTLNELMEYGYLTRKQLKDENGKFTNSLYTIYEEPLYQKPTSAEPISEKVHNKILNNKELNNKRKKEIYKEKRFQKPSLEEVKEYCLERNNSVDAEMFIDYYESNGWKVGKNSMKDWKACVRTWERNKINQHKETRYERERRLLQIDEE